MLKNIYATLAVLHNRVACTCASATCSLYCPSMYGMFLFFISGGIAVIAGLHDFVDRHLIESYQTRGVERNAKRNVADLRIPMRVSALA